MVRLWFLGTCRWVCPPMHHCRSFCMLLQWLCGLGSIWYWLGHDGTAFHLISHYFGSQWWGILSWCGCCGPTAGLAWFLDCLQKNLGCMGKIVVFCIGCFHGVCTCWLSRRSRMQWEWVCLWQGVCSCLSLVCFGRCSWELQQGWPLAVLWLGCFVCMFPFGMQWMCDSLWCLVGRVGLGTQPIWWSFWWHPVLSGCCQFALGFLGQTFLPAPFEQTFEGPQVIVTPPDFEGTGWNFLEGTGSSATSNGHMLLESPPQCQPRCWHWHHGEYVPNCLVWQAAEDPWCLLRERKMVVEFSEKRLCVRESIKWLWHKVSHGTGDSGNV